MIADATSVAGCLLAPFGEVAVLAIGVTLAWATARVVSAVAACSGCRRQRIAGQKRGGIALLEKVTHADGGLLGALDTSILTEGLVTLVLGTTSRCLGCCNRL